MKRAAERHLFDLVEGPGRGLTWSPQHALKACRFFDVLRHSKGEWAGQAVKLEPWQVFVVGSVFGWLREDGTRRFRRVYEEIPRKNGKSFLLAGVGVYALIGDGEPGAEVYAAATKKDQARIIFDEAKRMVRASPALRSAITVVKLNLSIDGTASKFEPLSNDVKTLDGLNPSTVLVDEVHKHESRELLDVLDTSLGARRQPLLWMITTAGDEDPESVYAKENHYATQILETTRTDDAQFCFITTIDKADAWDDPLAWAKANPNLNVSVKLSRLTEEANRAKGSPSALAAFKRLYLNVRTSDDTKAIDAETWKRNGLGRIDPASLRGRECYQAIDLSSKLDVSASVRLFPPAVAGERWKVLAKFWIPSDTIDERKDKTDAPFRAWVDDGWVEATPGNIIDHDTIRERVIIEARECNPLSIAYDPWNATQLALQLGGEGLPVVEFIQGLKSYTAPTKELLAWLKAEKLDHGNNPVLTWMASNLHVQTDKNENLMPTKKHSRGRIDGMTALIMAIGRAILDQGSGSVYDDIGRAAAQEG